MRHLDHPDLLGKDETKHCAECKTDVHCPHVTDAVVEDGEDDCDQHAKSTDAVADFAILNFAHESDATKDTEGKDDCESKVCPLCVFTHKTHTTNHCDEACCEDK